MKGDFELKKQSFRTQSLVDSVAETLRQAILDGKIEGGEAIRQGFIAETFDISRIPVREALLKLEGEGLVEAVPRRGFIVTTLSAKGFNEILEMRYALESLAIELAVPKFTQIDLQESLEIVRYAQSSMPEEGNENLYQEFESRWGDLNWTFHKRLYIVAQRPRLLAWIENLQHLFARQLSSQINLQNKPNNEKRGEGLRANRQEWQMVLEEHRELALACGDQDVVRAKQILKTHIFTHGKKLLHQIYG